MKRTSFVHALGTFAALAASVAVTNICALAPAPAPALAQLAETSVSARLAQYKTVRLTTDLSRLSEKERRMVGILIDAAREMDAIYWEEAYGNRDSLLTSIGDPDTRRLVEINYGPWDRLDGNAPFVLGVGPKPPGANFYPHDMSKEEFAKATAEGDPRAAALKSLYTLVRRDASGELVAVPYHEAFRARISSAAGKLRAAAAFSEDPALAHYLRLRSEALHSDEYKESDLAWLDMKENGVDVVIGPIETYEDALYEQKAAHEAFVLVKDREWSRRLARYAALLPDLQRGLPVAGAYKQESPGSNSDLNAYDAVFYAGDANAGAKTIAINLPNDESVQLEKGTRRLQLKNAMRAKFDEILVPMADRLIDPSQRQHVTFDAFFGNTMFHEVAHGLGIKKTINGRGLVREALREQGGALEEGKADILGLYMVTRLAERGELGEADVRDNLVTFLAGTFRSIRFGASSAHARANVACFRFLESRGAFTRDPATGRYRVDFDRMREAVDALSAKILTLQGDGDYDGTAAYIATGVLSGDLEADLQKISGAGIPVDIVFEQGMSVLEGTK